MNPVAAFLQELLLRELREDLEVPHHLQERVPPHLLLHLRKHGEQVTKTLFIGSPVFLMLFI